MSVSGLRFVITGAAVGIGAGTARLAASRGARVVVSDMADFERLHRDALTRLPGVARVNSSVAIRTVQKKTELPLH